MTDSEEGMVLKLSHRKLFGKQSISNKIFQCSLHNFIAFHKDYYL